MNQADEFRAPLTNRQREYYETIGRFFCKHYRPPHYPELAALMGIAHQTSLNQIIQALIDKGYLNRSPGGRGYVLPIDQNRGHLVRLKPGQSFEFAGIYVGVFEVDQETRAVGLEVIGPEIVGEPQTEQGEIIT